jgi:superfamily II DNA helicase RecQ
MLRPFPIRRPSVSFAAARLEESARRGVPAYVVLHDRTLEALASTKPASLDALSSVPGIGPAKLEAYGPALLRLLASR